MSVILVCWNSPTQGTSPISHVVQGAATSFGQRFVKNKQIEGSSPGGAALSHPNTRIALLFSPAGENRPSVQHFRDANARSHPGPFPQWREQQRHRAGQRLQHHSLQEKHGARGARLQVKCSDVAFDLICWGPQTSRIMCKSTAANVVLHIGLVCRYADRSPLYVAQPSAPSSPLSSRALLSC